MNSGTESEGLPGTFTLNPRICTSGRKDLPWPVGHLQCPGESLKHLVHSKSGPACTFRWPGDSLRGFGSTLIYDDRAPPGVVRGLTNLEVWKIQGGKAAEWTPLNSKQGNTCMRVAMRALNPRTALEILRSLEEQIGPGLADGRAGLCEDPDDETGLQELTSWLAAWKANLQEPKAKLETYLTSAAGFASRGGQGWRCQEVQAKG